MPDEYTPLTTEQFHGMYSSEEGRPSEEQTTNFLKFATEAQLSEEHARQFVAFDESRRPTKPEPITLDTLKTFYPDQANGISETQANSFIEIATKHGLAGEAIKDLVGFDQARLKAADEAAESNWADLQKQWKEELNGDSMFLGGAGRDQNLSAIGRILNDYGGEVKESGLNEVREALNVTGAGNHPAIMRFLLRVAQALPGEGQPAQTGGRPAPKGPLTFEQMAAIIAPNT